MLIFKLDFSRPMFSAERQAFNSRMYRFLQCASLSAEICANSDYSLIVSFLPIDCQRMATLRNIIEISGIKYSQVLLRVLDIHRDIICDDFTEFAEEIDRENLK